MRTPVFELHIVPMFRATDREHMAFSFGLHDYDDVVENADAILERLEGDNMPPADSAGPWPEEWTALFKRWMESGKKRLEIGTAEFTFAASAAATTITAAGTFPKPGYTGWLQIESETETAKTYVLYFEAPDAPATGDPETFSMRERYRGDPRTVFVHDSAGVKQLS